MKKNNSGTAAMFRVPWRTQDRILTSRRFSSLKDKGEVEHGRGVPIRGQFCHHLQENGKEEEETSQRRLEENLKMGIFFFGGGGVGL